jgi:hypothetical protein
MIKWLRGLDTADYILIGIILFFCLLAAWDFYQAAVDNQGGNTVCIFVCGE